MRRFICVLLTLATLFSLVSCGGKGEKSQETPKPADPLSKIESVLDKKTNSPKNEAELDEMIADLIAACDDGRNISMWLYGNSPDLESIMQEKGYVFKSAVEFDIVTAKSIGTVPYDLLDTLDGEFLLSLVNKEDIERIVLMPGGMYQDPNFPEFEVTMYLGGEKEKIFNTRHLEVQLQKMADACKEGAAYKGMGVYLHGFEVQKGDITGVPYCYLSYGTKDQPKTVLGFDGEAIQKLDAKSVVDLILLCPYFTSVDFFASKNPQEPVLNP